MIVAFDLDDTLYPEETFVASGFRAVAGALHERWGVDLDEAFSVMWASLRDRGRGNQFDDAVAHFGLGRRQSVAELVRVYRHHDPGIALPRETVAALDRLAPRPLYVVTDGHKVVQQSKIDALGLAPRLRHAYVTHRYGIANRKPSARVFELLIARERCRPSDVVYVADDPSKDFRGIRPLGLRTIRVLTGRHARVEAPADTDAERTVAGIADVPAAVRAFEAGERAA